MFASAVRFFSWHTQRMDSLTIFPHSFASIYSISVLAVKLFHSNTIWPFLWYFSCCCIFLPICLPTYSTSSFVKHRLRRCHHPYFGLWCLFLWCQKHTERPFHVETVLQTPSLCPEKNSFSLHFLILQCNVSYVQDCVTKRNSQGIK